jgi:hypothetical protein
MGTYTEAEKRRIKQARSSCRIDEVADPQLLNLRLEQGDKNRTSRIRQGARSDCHARMWTNHQDVDAVRESREREATFLAGRGCSP